MEVLMIMPERQRIVHHSPWLLLLVFALLHTAGCALQPQGAQGQGLKGELASIREEVQQCRKEIQALRLDQEQLAAKLLAAQKEAVQKLMQDLANSASAALLNSDLLGQDPDATPPSAEPPEAPVRHAGSKPRSYDPSRWVKKVGKNRYHIKRRGLDRALQDTTWLARSARVVPAVRDGKPAGFILYAIRPGSLYFHLGLQNGDTLEEINGMAITTPDTALDVYVKIRDSDQLSLQVRRRGVLKKMFYKIVP